MSIGSTPCNMTVFEAIHSLRAVRQFRPDPVPHDYICRILQAGTMACSVRNTQPWEFVVLGSGPTDRKLRVQIQGWVMEAVSHVLEKGLGKGLASDELALDGSGSVVGGPISLIGTAPCAILVLWNPERGIWAKFGEEYRKNPDGTLTEIQPTQGRGSSLFLACQNMMLAARALGLGSILFRSVVVAEMEIKQLLRIPPKMFLETAILIGYPATKLGRPRRKPIEEVTHWTFWENPSPTRATISMARDDSISMARDDSK